MAVRKLARYVLGLFPAFLPLLMSGPLFTYLHTKGSFWSDYVAAYLEQTMYISFVLYVAEVYSTLKLALFTMVALHCAIVYLDLNAMYFMQSYMNSQLLSNVLSSFTESHSMNREQIRATLWLLFITILPEYLLFSIYIRYVRYSRTLSSAVSYFWTSDRNYGLIEKYPFMAMKEDDDSEFSALEQDVPKRSKKSIKWRTLIPMLISLGVLTYHGSYSPTSNFIKYTFEYFTTTEIEFDFENDIKYLNLTESNSTKPNLVFVLNESMGNYFGMYPNGTNINSTYFNNQIKNQKDFFVMNNARGISGNTETATPGIFMGRYIVSEKNTQETKSYFKIDSMMSLARANGYKTALFCSYQTQFSHGWKQLSSVFDQFDLIVSQATLNAEVVNDYGMDDRNLTTRILNYLDAVDPNQPFLLTIIWNNLHYPFLVGEDFIPPDDTEEERDRARYAHSIGITDMMMGSVMDAIKRKQILNNTIISFSADHGETPGEHARITKPTSRVLSVPLWFHIPNYFLTRTQRQNLRWNAHNGTISTLDMVPTLIDVMKWKDMKDLYPSSNATVHGQSLLNKLPENRWISGWAGPPFVPNCDWRHAFIANRTHVYWIHSWSKSYTLEINNGPNFAIVNSTSSYELEELQNMQKESRLPLEMLLPTCYGHGLF